MDKLKAKLHLPKARTFHGGDLKSLESMVKESMYFVWPVASGVQDEAASSAPPSESSASLDSPEALRQRQRGKLEKQNNVLTKHESLLPRFVLHRDGTSVDEPLDSDEERSVPFAY